MSENVLTIENATMQFGGVVAVDNLNLKVDKDQIVSLIGPNGAGRVDPVTPGPDVKPQPDGKDPDKGDKIFGGPIKFTVTVTPWNPTDNDINM